MEDRQRARVDLLFLCNEVLEYKDIEQSLHGPIMERLQKFKGGVDVMGADGQVSYTPACSLWELEGPRERLFLDPRGHLKTTLITQAHSIQWIINYPDVRILGSMATGDQVAKVMIGILNHFRFNEKFRFLFPEFCPAAKSAKDFGNMDSFTVPCRKSKWLREPTFSTCSVGKVIAGSHYEVIKHSDLVDKENIKTPNQIGDVISHFRYMMPLLERGPVAPFRGWTDVEGTRYDFSDLYGDIEDSQAKLPEAEREWQIHSRDAEVDSEKHIALWPKKFPWEELKRIEREMGPYIYSAQYRQRPIPVGSGLASREMIRFKPRREMMSYLQRLHMTVDLAGMNPDSKGDFTVLTTAGFDRDGRMNVPDIRAGHFDPFEVISMMYLLCKLYPGICDIKIEKDAHARVLLPFLTREQQKRGFLPPLVPIQRDNRTSKKQRIKGLQPWFRGELIVFAEEIGCKLELIQQVCRFSDTSSYHDDILDTLADQMQNREGGVNSDVIPDAPRGSNVLPWPEKQFYGFDPMTKREMWWGDQQSGPECYDRMTGL